CPDQRKERGNCQEVYHCNQPMNQDAKYRDEDDAHHRQVQHVNDDVEEFFCIGPRLLKFAQSFAAALIFEDGVREFQGMPDSIGIHLGSQALRDDVGEVVLEVLGNAGNKSPTNRHRQPKADAADEYLFRQLFVWNGIVIDDASEDVRVEQREDLVDGRKDQRQDDEWPVMLEIGIEQFHVNVTAMYPSPAAHLKMGGTLSRRERD